MLSAQATKIGKMMIKENIEAQDQPFNLHPFLTHPSTETSAREGEMLLK